MPFLYIPRTASTCPEPPISSPASGSSLVMSTGQSFLDVSFYRCPRIVSEQSDAESDRITAAVCQLDGSWSDPYPDCDSTDILTPEHPDHVPIDDRRQQTWPKWAG